jgi:hypothetical protein
MTEEELRLKIMAIYSNGEYDMVSRDRYYGNVYTYVEEVIRVDNDSLVGLFGLTYKQYGNEVSIQRGMFTCTELIESNDAFGDDSIIQDIFKERGVV